MVGTAPTIRVSSVILPSPSSGTLKSHLTRTLRPLNETSVIVFLGIVYKGSLETKGTPRGAFSDEKILITI